MADTFQTEIIPLRQEPTPLGSMDYAGTVCRGRGTGWKHPRLLGMDALVLLLEGDGLYRTPRGPEIPLRPGDLLYVAGRQPHQYGPLAGRVWNEIYVCFHGRPFDAWHQSGSVDPRRPVRTMASVAYGLERMRELADPSAPAVVLAARVHSLLADTFGSLDSGIWLDKARLLLRGAGSGGLEAVAESCGLSYESFRKRFRAATGESPAAYRRRHLVLQAAGILRRSQATNAELAEQLGFCDAFHFSRVFQKQTGLTPREFRLRLDKGMDGSAFSPTSRTSRLKNTHPSP
jgi:AraC-like DNA-binding protein